MIARIVEKRWTGKRFHGGDELLPKCVFAPARGCRQSSGKVLLARNPGRWQSAAP
jgi:hypothetical protein